MNWMIQMSWMKKNINDIEMYEVCDYIYFMIY